MKKYNMILILIAAMMTSCITETIDKMSQFTVQIPIYYKPEYKDRIHPSSSVEFTNLNEYTEYRDNRDMVEKAEVYQFNYRIDSLVMPNKEIYDPNVHDLRFEYIRYKIIFAKPKYGDENSLNPSDFEYDLTQEPIVLGEYQDVNIRDYFRQSNNIKTVDDKVTNTISDILKKKPYFFIMTEYGNRIGNYPAKEVFPFVLARFDVVVRLGIKL